MRAVRYHDYGGPAVLGVDEVERPEPGPDEVLVEVAAAGVNPVDTYFREGAKEPFALPMTPGVDVSGVVAETGPGVEGFAPGDRVYGTGLGRDHPGGYAEYAVVPTDRLVALPEGVDLVAAGGAGVACATAWRALVDKAGLEPAETCLVHGGSGGVGHAAVQLAATTGARVVATAAPAYHDRVREFGADAVLDYDRADLAEAVRAAAGGGLDVVVDHRLDDYLQFDADVAATGGRIVGIGENDPAVGLDRSSPARGKDLTLSLMSMFNAPDLRVPLRRVARLLAEGDLSVHVARTYGLDDAGAAQRDVTADSFVGKLVLVP